MGWWAWLLIGVGIGASWPVWALTCIDLMNRRYERKERGPRPMTRARLIGRILGEALVMACWLFLIIAFVLAVVQGGWHS